MQSAAAVESDLLSHHPPLRQYAQAELRYRPTESRPHGKDDHALRPTDLVCNRKRFAVISFVYRRPHIVLWRHHSLRWFGDLESKWGRRREGREGMLSRLFSGDGTLMARSQAALSAGYRHIDCAWEYGVHHVHMNHGPGTSSHRR